MYRKDIVDLGSLTIGDLIFTNGSFSPDFLTSLTSPEQRFLLMSTVNSIPSKWHSLAKACTSISLSASSH